MSFLALFILIKLILQKFNYVLAMNKKLNVIFKNHVNLTQEKAWSATAYESCFQIKLEVLKTEDNLCLITLECSPDKNDGYELLIDYQLEVDGLKEFIERDKWDVSRSLLKISYKKCEFDIILAVFVREVLVSQDLSVSTNFRNFRLISSQYTFYVNTTQLNTLGGKLFKEWYEAECLGESSAVIQRIDIEELRILLNSASAYSIPLIHRNNFITLLELTKKYHIIGLLRCLETFIIESTTIHNIQKLEYSIEYRMTRLADYVLRLFKTRIERIECLFEYLSNNNKALEDLNSDVLEMLEITKDYIIL